MEIPDKNPSLDVENDEQYSEMLRCGEMTVGMVYVPVQAWKNPYEINEGFARGTLFHELDKPFFGEDLRR